MSQSNIDNFNEVTGRIFLDLYDSFPQPFQIDFDNYLTPLSNSTDPVEDVVYNFYERRFISDSVTWLKETGYLTSISDDEYSFYGTVLTEKGLECLKKVPTSLVAQTPLGTQLKDAIRSGSVDAVRSLTSTVITAGATIAAQHFGMSL
ncbi:hypothetical protein ACNPGY_16070 [Citrobacter cronae]|uniref:hypothetical protein n=1 Tax=Citrobacter cronae TaxID=1748967 RepID=UPI0034E49C1A